MTFNYEAPETVERPTGDSLIYTKSRVMIVKKLTFDAAHHLYDYDGKCRALKTWRRGFLRRSVNTFQTNVDFVSNSSNSMRRRLLLLKSVVSG